MPIRKIAPRPAGPGNVARQRNGPGRRRSIRTAIRGALSVSPPLSFSPPDGSSAGSSANSNSLTTNALLGYVDDHPIFIADLFSTALRFSGPDLTPAPTLDDQLRQLARTSPDVEQFRSSARTLINTELTSRIYDVIRLSAAEAMLGKDDNTRIDYALNKAMSDLVTKHGGSEAAASKYLLSMGWTLDQFRAAVRDEFLRELYAERKFKAQVVVTRDMLSNAYNRDPKKWQQDAWVELYTITLPVQRWLHQPGNGGQTGPLIANPTPEQIKMAESQATAFANQIIAQAKKGIGFDRLVENADSRDPAADTGGRWPDGATLGHVPNKKLESYIFSLPANTIAAPFLLEDPDFHNSTVMVIKVGEKRPAGVTSFDVAQKQLTETLREQAYVKLQQDDMIRLLQNAPVEHVADRRSLDIAVDAAVARYSPPR